MASSSSCTVGSFSASLDWLKKPALTKFTDDLNDIKSDCSLESMLFWLYTIKSSNKITNREKSWIKKRIAQLECCSKISSHLNFCSGMSTWSEISAYSSEHPTAVLKHLIENQKFYLAAEFIECYYSEEKCHPITKLKLLNHCIRDAEPLVQDATNIFQMFSKSDIQVVVKNLLTKEHSPHFRKFLIDYYFNVLQCIFSYKYPNQLNLQHGDLELLDELLGHHLVDSVTDDVEKSQLRSIVKKPKLILEQWIINFNIKAVQKALDMIYPSSNECILGSLVVASRKHYRCSTNEESCLCWRHYHDMIECYILRTIDMFGQASEITPNDIIAKTPEHPSQRSKNLLKFLLHLLFSNKKKGLEIQASESICEQAISNKHFKNQLKYVIKTALSTENEATDAVKWYFSTHRQHNDMIRQQFRFQYTSSASVCESLLSLHRDEKRIVDFIIKNMSNLLFALDKCPKESYGAIVNIMHLFVRYAIIIHNKLSESENISVLRFYKGVTDLFKFTVSNNLREILPSDYISNILNIAGLLQKEFTCSNQESILLNSYLVLHQKHLCILRDSLTRSEKFEDALKVSSKAGLATTFVWCSWGMSLIKGGNFPAARKIFSNVLSRATSKSTKSMVLTDIVYHLENMTSVTDQGCFTNLSLAPGLENLDSSRCPEASHIFQILKGVDHIASGNSDFLYTCNTNQKLCVTNEHECVFYLKTYGNSKLVLQYFIKHNQFEKAAAYAHDGNVEGKSFAEAVLISCFRRKKLASLLEGMRAVALKGKKEWFAATVLSCYQFLEEKVFLHCLLELQRSLDDKFNGANTLLKLYSKTAASYSDLLMNRYFLDDAILYIQESNFGFRQLKGNKYRSLERSLIVKNCKPEQMRELQQLCEMQKIISRYLNDVEKNECSLAPLLRQIKKIFRRYKNFTLRTRSLERSNNTFDVTPFTIFIKDDQICTSVLCVCADRNTSTGLSLAKQLVSLARLPTDLILFIALEVLICFNRYSNLMNVTKTILNWKMIPEVNLKSTITSAICILLPAVPEDKETIEALVNFLPDTDDKIDAYITIGALKKSINLMIATRKFAKITKLRDVALERGDQTIADLCSKLT